MNKTAKIAVIAVVAIAGLAVADLTYFRGSWQCRDGAWVAAGHPLKTHPQIACAKPEVVPPKEVCSPPWSCGSLHQGELGMKPGVWYLKYDDVTGPAKLEIVFVDGAQCRVDGVVADCTRMNPTSGSASSFSGYKDGDMFRVSSLDFKTK